MPRSLSVMAVEPATTMPIPTASGSPPSKTTRCLRKTATHRNKFISLISKKKKMSTRLMHTIQSRMGTWLRTELTNQWCTLFLTRLGLIYLQNTEDLCTCEDTQGSFSQQRWALLLICAISATLPHLQSALEHENGCLMCFCFYRLPLQETCPNNAKSRQSPNTHKPLPGVHEEDINASVLLPRL